MQTQTVETANGEKITRNHEHDTTRDDGPSENNPSVISSDSNEQNEDRKNRFRFSEGILLALAPAYAYLLTFQYEKV